MPFLLFIFFFSPLVSPPVGFFCQYYPFFVKNPLIYEGRVSREGDGFYFVRLENKNPYLGEPRWTTSGWPASRFKFVKKCVPTRDTTASKQKQFYIFTIAVNILEQHRECMTNHYKIF